MSSTEDAKVYDVLIVGAGPAGLFGAFYAGMREMSCKVIDALPEVGGQVTALYPEKKIFDTPGFPGIVGKELVARLHEQANLWDTAFSLADQAQTLERVPMPGAEEDQECWAIGTDDHVHLGKTVVICGGIGAFRPRKLRNETIDQFEGKGVEYFVTDMSAYEGKRVLIVGGGDSAIDWALATEPLAEQVTLIHRREGFRAHEASLNKLAESSVDVKVWYELRELQGDDELERAVIFDNRTDEDEVLEVDKVVLALGFKADLGPIRQWGLETVGRRYIAVNSRMETNLPGIYAAGDISQQDGLDPLNLIVVGYGQVTIAINYAFARVNPGGNVFPGHSSEKMGES